MWMQIVYYYDGAQRYEQFLQVSQLCGFLLLGLALYHPSASVSLVFIVLTEWASYTLATERSIPLVPVNNISVEESYQRFCGAMQKAARHSIPRGFHPTYTPYLDEECQDLLKQYEESGDPDIADHLIESLNVARRHRWEERTSKMNFTHSSRKSWAPIRRLGAAQQPPKSTPTPMPLPLISSRLLKHRTTRSSNVGFLCRGELFCSRCQTRVFPIHSLKRTFQLLCRRRNQQQLQVTTTSTWNS